MEIDLLGISGSNLTDNNLAIYIQISQILLSFPIMLYFPNRTMHSMIIRKGGYQRIMDYCQVLNVPKTIEEMNIHIAWDFYDQIPKFYF